MERMRFNKEYEKMTYREILAMMNDHLATSQQADFPQEVLIEGLLFRVYKNVFSPIWYDDARFYTRELLKIVPRGSKFLEIGCGAGVTAVTLAKHGCQVTATDINVAAVKNCEDNAKINEVAVKVLESDVFGSIEGKFDCIFWDVPYGHLEEEFMDLSDLQKAIFDRNYHNLNNYIKSAANFLNLDGRIFLGFSTILGRVEKLIEIANEKA